MAEFSLATGLRQSNVTHLEWSQVDLGRRSAWIHADQAKGKRDLAVPLSDAPFAGNSGLAKPQDVEIDRAQNRSHDVLIADDEEEEILFQINGVADGTRTHDNRNHNPGLYQLSYSHH